MEATIKMVLGTAAHLAALHHLLDKIDAAARPVQLIAGELIGGTRGGTKTAVHAGAEYRLRLPTFGSFSYRFNDGRLHDQIVWLR